MPQLCLRDLFERNNFLRTLSSWSTCCVMSSRDGCNRPCLVSKSALYSLNWTLTAIISAVNHSRFPTRTEIYCSTTFFKKQSAALTPSKNNFVVLFGGHNWGRLSRKHITWSLSFESCSYLLGSSVFLANCCSGCSATRSSKYFTISWKAISAFSASSTMVAKSWTVGFLGLWASTRQWASKNLFSGALSHGLNLGFCVTHFLIFLLTTQSHHKLDLKPFIASSIKSRKARSLHVIDKPWFRYESWKCCKAEGARSYLDVKSRKLYVASFSAISSSTMETHAAGFEKLDEEPYKRLSTTRSSSRSVLAQGPSMTATVWVIASLSHLVHFFFARVIIRAEMSSTLPLNCTCRSHPTHAQSSQ